MWSGLVKIQYTELKLSWGNDPVIKNSINSNSDLDLWPNDPIWIGFFPFHRAIMWSSLVKIQYTELKLSCENDPVVKNYIYSNGDLDLWPNDPKINRVLPLSQGNHVAKFGKDPIYRTKVIVRKPVWTPPARPPAIPNHIIRPVSRRAYKKELDIIKRYNFRKCILYMLPLLTIGSRYLFIFPNTVKPVWTELFINSHVANLC
jgi:hypothetical protein